MTSATPDEVVVVVGSGAMGAASARRLASGRHLILADFSTSRLEQASDELRSQGHAVDCVLVDVRDTASVCDLARTAAEAGAVRAVVHTAGVSPTQASSRDIIDIDLAGTARVLEAFAGVSGRSTTVVCISSMAGHRAALSASLEQQLATVAPDDLLALPDIDYDSADTSTSYDIAKRGVHLRVRAAAPVFGARGARVNSVSPGIVATPMSLAELGNDHGGFMRELITGQPVPRIGTPEDIAEAVDFLCSSRSAFITGTDLLVDGGATCAPAWRERETS